MEAETDVQEVEPVEMPDPDAIPAESVDTATAFGNTSPIGRTPAERVAEIEEAPQTSEGSDAANVRPVNTEGGQLEVGP